MVFLLNANTRPPGSTSDLWIRQTAVYGGPPQGSGSIWEGERRDQKSKGKGIWVRADAAVQEWWGQPGEYFRAEGSKTLGAQTVRRRFPRKSGRVFREASAVSSGVIGARESGK